MVRRHIVSITVLAAACALAIPLAAGNGHDKPEHTAVECPPGLAKKSSQCVPPGASKRFYRRGDHILDNYIWIGDPGHWAPDPYGSYVQAGGYVYQVNRETQKVLRLIGAMADLSN
ncbi:carbohydrate porin [Leisingera thetidis]|uniref:carbohydrate porin n=1 Tax=Leisingera thetidis TaxID=2930199 RepID=UPI0021F7C6C5|nr:carbohydrate porin [Leisingera thetidis]